MFYYKISRLFLKLVLYLCLCPIRIRNRQHIPREGGVIIAANHKSLVDPPVVGVASYRVLRFMVKDSLLNVPILGWWLKLVGVIPLKRGVSDLGAMRSALRCLARQEVIILFPEGTRRKTGQGQAKGLAGVGFLARKSGCPVLPAYIQGTERALPPGAKFIRPSKIDIIFGSPIAFDKQKTPTDQEFAAQVMEAIGALKKED